jgi:hypothetical protein
MANRIITISLFLSISTSIFGQIQNNRFNDNFDVLRKDSLKTNTLFPFLKSIVISPNNKLSFGGEIREQVQYFKNENWAANGNLNDDKISIMQRYMVHTNLTLGKQIRFFSEIGSMFENGRSTPSRIIDEDKLDLHQAFLDFNITFGKERNLLLRIGRQEMAYAQGKLFHYRDATNVRQYYQGIKAEFKNKKYQIDAFYMHPLTYSIDVFDDHRNSNAKFWGVWGKFNLKNVLSTTLESYVLGNHKENSAFYNQSGNQDRYTWGIKWAKNNQQAFNFDIDAALQTGKIGENNILAYNIQGEISYKIPIVWKPTIRIATEFVSGDKTNTAQLETFDILYPLNVYGLALPMAPTNVNDLQLGITVQPHAKLDVKGQVFFITRNSNQDALYSPSMKLVHDAKTINTQQFSDKDYICTMYWLQASYNFTKYIQLGITYNYINDGNYIKDTQNNSKDTHFLNTTLRLRF